MAFIKSTYRYLFILIILMSGLFPSALTAKVFIKTEIVTGQIISITKEHSIELNDGFLYYPAKKDISISIKPGETISIRYYIDANYERKYIDWAAGKNSIEAVPVPKSTARSKNKL